MWLEILVTLKHLQELPPKALHVNWLWSKLSSISNANATYATLFTNLTPFYPKCCIFNPLYNITNFFIIHYIHILLIYMFFRRSSAEVSVPGNVYRLRGTPLQRQWAWPGHVRHGALPDPTKPTLGHSRAHRGRWGVWLWISPQ